MLKRKQKTLIRCIGVFVVMIIMMSGLALAQDVPAPSLPSTVERGSNQKLTMPEGQECCWCAQNA